MKKILVLGLSDQLGGVETFFHTYYQYMNGKKYHFDFATVCKTIAFAEEYTKRGSSIYYLPHFMKHPIGYYKTLKKILRNNKYDVIHINMLSAANILPVKAAKSEKTPKIIIHSHSSDIPSGFLRKILNKINIHTLRDKELTKLACGQKAGEWLFGKNSQFKIINNAIDIERFRFNKKARKEIRSKYGIKDNEILLGNVGHICTNKNQSFLVDLLDKLDEKYKLMLIGDGEKKDELKNTVKTLSITKRVIFVDSTKEIEKYYSAFDIFVFPSLFEGMPVAPIEAQANGLRCLISDSITRESNLGNALYLRLDSADWIRNIALTKGRSNKGFIHSRLNIQCQKKHLEEVYEG